MPGFMDFLEDKARQLNDIPGDIVDGARANPTALIPLPQPLPGVLTRGVSPAISQAVRERSPGPIWQGMKGSPGAIENIGSAVAQGINNAAQAAAPGTWFPNIYHAGSELVRNPGVDNALRFATTVAEPSLELANTPVTAVHTEQGEGAWYVATHGGEMRDVDAASPYNHAVRWALENPQEWYWIQQAHDKGFNGFTGNRAVWEYYIGKQDRSTRFENDITNDPWNLLLFAGPAKAGITGVGRGLAEGAEVGSKARAFGSLLEDLGTVVGKTESGIQQAMDLPYSIPLKGARAAVRQIPGEAALESRVGPWLAENIFKESKGSLADRQSNRAATATDIGVNPLDMQELPSWAVPVEGTGQYEVIQPGDPRTNGGQAYMVDPNGNPIPGRAMIGKGEAKKLRKGADRYNAGGENLPVGENPVVTTRNVPGATTPASWVNPQATITTREGVDEGTFPGTAPTGKWTINNSVVRSGEAGMTQPFPTTGPYTEEGLSRGWVNGQDPPPAPNTTPFPPPEGPIDGSTPFDFQQTVGQRQAYVDNGATPMAPNIRPGDARISTLVEQARATNPTAVAAFEQAAGFDRATGGAIPGTPYGNLQRDIAALPRWYEAADGGLPARAVDERLIYSGYTVRQQAPIYEQTFGTRLRPDVPTNAKGPIEEMVRLLHSDIEREQSNGAAQLIGRFIFGTDEDAIKAANAILDFEKDHAWMGPRFDEANAIRQDMRKRWDMNTPQRTTSADAFTATAATNARPGDTFTDPTVRDLRWTTRQDGAGTWFEGKRGGAELYLAQHEDGTWYGAVLGNDGIEHARGQTFEEALGKLQRRETLNGIGPSQLWEVMPSTLRERVNAISEAEGRMLGAEPTIIDAPARMKRTGANAVPTEPSSVQQNMAGTRIEHPDPTYPMPTDIGLMDRSRRTAPAAFSPEWRRLAEAQRQAGEPITPYGQWLAEQPAPPAEAQAMRPANQRRNPRDFRPVDRVPDTGGPDLPTEGPLAENYVPPAPEPDITPQEPIVTPPPDTTTQAADVTPQEPIVTPPPATPGEPARPWSPDKPRVVKERPAVTEYPSGANLDTDPQGKWVYTAPDGRTYRVAQSPGSKSATVHGEGGDVIEGVKGDVYEVAKTMDGYYDPKWDKGASPKTMKRDLVNKDGMSTEFTAHANKGARTKEPVWWVEDGHGNVIDDHRTLFGAQNRTVKGRYTAAAATDVPVAEVPLPTQAQKTAGRQAAEAGVPVVPELNTIDLPEIVPPNKDLPPYEPPAPKPPEPDPIEFDLRPDDQVYEKTNGAVGILRREGNEWVILDGRGMVSVRGQLVDDLFGWLDARGFTQRFPTEAAPNPVHPESPTNPVSETTPVQQAAPTTDTGVRAEPPETASVLAKIQKEPGKVVAEMVNTDGLSTDPARFQKRDDIEPAGYNEERVQNLVANYNTQKLRPLVVWHDPADGKVYVLAGHHRLEASRRVGAPEVPAQLFHGDEAEAMAFAAESNSEARQTLVGQINIARQANAQKHALSRIASDLGTTEGQAIQLVNAGYAPQNLIDNLRTEGAEGAASLSLISTYGRYVKAGELDANEVGSVFTYLKDRNGGKLPTIKESVGMLDITAAVRKSQLEGTANPLAKGRLAALFDTANYGGNESVNNVIRDLEALGVDLKNNKQFIKDAEKTARTGAKIGANIDVAADPNVRLANEQAADLQRRIDNFDLANAFGAAPAPKVVATPLGNAYELPGLPEETLTLNAQTIPEDVAPELTPEQIREQQKAAGQTDMFGIVNGNPKANAWAADKFDSVLNRPRALPEPEVPATDSLLDQLVQNAVVDSSQAAVLREQFPGMKHSLFTEYADRLRMGMTEEEARTAIRKQVYAAINPEQQLSKVRWKRMLQQSWNVIKAVNAAARQNMMYNILNTIPGIGGDFIGNNIHLYQTANYTAGRDSARVLALAFKGGEESVANAFSVPYDPVLAGWGRNQPEHIIPRSGQAVLNNQGFNDENLKIWSWSRTLAKKAGKEDIPGFVKPVLSVLSLPKGRSVRQGLDAGNKAALFDAVLDDNLDQYVNDFMVNLQDAGIPAQATIDAIRNRATELRAPKGFQGQLRSFSPQDVIDVTGNKRMGQIWAETRNKAYTQAADEVKRVYFAGAKRLMLDDAMANVFFFHFWQTRALALQTRSMLRNPRVLGQYYRMIQGAMREADENGYPPTFRGLTHYWGDTNAGFYALFNPLGVIIPAMMFGDLANSRKDAGGWEKISSILPVTPMFQAAVSALGLSDQTPYIMGTARVQNMVADVMSWGNAHGYDFAGGLTGSGVVDDPVQAMTRKVLSGINWLTSNMGSGEFHPYVSKNGKVDTIRAVALELAQQQYGPMEQWTPEQQAYVQDAMMAIDVGGKGNTLSDEAFTSWADANIRNRMAGSVLPQGSVLRYGPRETDRNLAQSDLDTPQVRSAQTRGALRTGTEDSIPLTMAVYEKNQIGGEFERQLNQAYSDIAYGTPKGDGSDPTYKIAGQTVTMTQLNLLTPEDRKLMAKAYVDQQGGTEALNAYWDATNAFEAGNPQLASYGSYTKTVNDYPGGAGAFRMWARDISPEFKRREAVARSRIRASGVTGKALENEMDGWARGQDAYLAFRAKKKNIYDQNPVGGQPNGDAMTTLQTMQLVQQLQQGQGGTFDATQPSFNPIAPTTNSWWRAP